MERGVQTSKMIITRVDQQAQVQCQFAVILEFEGTAGFVPDSPGEMAEKLGGCLKEFFALQLPSPPSSHAVVDIFLLAVRVGFVVPNELLPSIRRGESLPSHRIQRVL